MLFQKSGCLVVTENWVKLKMFSVLTVKQGQRGVKYFPLLFSLQTISGDVQREKQGEKEGLTEAQTQRERERERERDRAVEPTIGPIRSPSSPPPHDGECFVHPSTTKIAHQHPSSNEIDPHPSAPIPPP